MRKVLKILKKVLFIGLGVYAALFAVFFFDLDGKALFYGVDPRTVSRKTMRDKVNEYMRTVMRAEPVDPTLLDFDDEICM